MISQKTDALGERGYEMSLSRSRFDRQVHVDFAVLRSGEDVCFDRAAAEQAACGRSRQAIRVTDSFPLERPSGLVPLTDVFFKFSVGTHADVPKRFLVGVVASDKQRLFVPQPRASEHKPSVENPFARRDRFR